MSRRRLYIDHHRLLLVGIVTTVLLSAVTAVASGAAQPAQPTDPVAVVTAFNAAVSAQDLTAALALLDPTFQYVSSPTSALPTDRGKGEFPGQPPFQQVTESNIQQIDAETVEMDLTFSGGPIPVLAHPFTLHAVFTVKNGLITRLEDQLSPQTAQDLAALGQSAAAVLPTTGVSDPHRRGVVVLGVCLALAGVLMRRARWLR